MSSTGRRSKVIQGALTILGEENRKQSMETIGSPSLFETSRQVEGTIYKVHEEKLLIKVYETANGATIAGDNWIPVSHSPQEIAERFGTIRQGMSVLVSYEGPTGSNAIASIILNEQEKTGEEGFTSNKLRAGLYEIFKPGT